ncbi:MAG TPA: hypothetical protein PKJ68_04450 [Candidatus Woesebacteria bacterium]|nr:hypothetical protein [Candidatus Woesebacteria bacterium]
MINQNSLLAYQSLDLTKSQKRVYEVLASTDKGMSMQQVANELKTEKHKISGRFGEMVKDGFIEVAEHVIENGSRVGVYRVKKKKTSVMEWYRQEVVNQIRQQNSIVNLGPDALF